MSTIKNLVKTFKEREKLVDDKVGEEIIAPIIEPVKEPEIVAVVAPKKEKKPTTEKVKVAKPAISQAITVSEGQPTRGDTKGFSLSDDFFASLNEQKFSYEKSKFAYIDKKLYEVLMTLKRKKDVKNISLLINAALTQFIEQNKEDIKKIFMDDLL
jgi:hypothetical protein